MSMPVYTIECNKCDYACNSMITWGRYEYFDGESNFPCKTCMGYCSDCNAITAVEYFEDTGVFEAQEIQQRAKCLCEANTSFWQNLGMILFASKRSSAVADVNTIIGLAKTLELTQNQQRSECCLQCASHNITHIRHNAQQDLDYDQAYTGASVIGFKHPGCGGDFIAVGSDLRFNVKRKTRIYSTNGRFIEERLG